MLIITSRDIVCCGWHRKRAESKEDKCIFWILKCYNSSFLHLALWVQNRSIYSLHIPFSITTSSATPSHLINILLWFPPLRSYFLYFHDFSVSPSAKFLTSNFYQASSPNSFNTRSFVQFYFSNHIFRKSQNTLQNALLGLFCWCACSCRTYPKWPLPSNYHWHIQVVALPTPLKVENAENKVNPVSQHRNPSDGEYEPHGNPTVTPGFHLPIRNTVGGSPLHLDKTTVKAQEPSIKRDGFESTSQNHGSPGMVTVPHNPIVLSGFHIPNENSIGVPIHLHKTTAFRAGEPSIKKDDQ
jgi:hypothetical protein